MVRVINLLLALLRGAGLHCERSFPASRLRSDVQEADIKPTLITAGALLTLSMLDASGFDNLQTLSAGTMQLTFDGKNDRRVRLALLMLEPFTSCATAFRGVVT